MAETIAIEIDEQGAAKIEVSGVVGRKCTDVTKQLENALGGDSSRTLKPEYHRQEVGRHVGH